MVRSVAGQPHLPLQNTQARFPLTYSPWSSREAGEGRAA